MQHKPQHLLTSLTRRRWRQGMLGSVAGLAAWQQGWRLHTAAAQPREPSGQIRRGEASMATIVHQGITLAYEDRGAGKPAFVFVHRWACNRTFFAPQAAHFVQRHRVVSIDLRGHGESDKPQGPYPIAAYADDLAYMIEHLSLGPVVAVGHSSGGMTVLQLAAAHPDRVTAIVMVACLPVRMGCTNVAAPHPSGGSLAAQRTSAATAQRSRCALEISPCPPTVRCQAEPQRVVAAAEQAHWRYAWPILAPTVPYRLPAEALRHLPTRPEATTAWPRGQRARACMA
jgi:pimeloyl-ACP methyl ester carboxylesterase